MRAVKLSSELDSPKERRVLLLCVLLGHALVFGLFTLQKANTSPQPLEIELSLSAVEPNQNPSPSPLHKSKSRISTERPIAKPVLPEPVEVPNQQLPTLRQAQGERAEIG